MSTVEPLATDAVKRVRNAAHHGGRVTSTEIVALAEEMLTYRRKQRRQVRAVDAQAAAIAAHKTHTPVRAPAPARPGPPRRPAPPAEQLSAGVAAYLDGASVSQVSTDMGVSPAVGRRLLVEAGVEIRRGGWGNRAAP